MQTEQRFRELLDKYLNGQCTPREKAVMESWFEQAAQQGATELPDKEKMLARIHRRQKRPRWRAAAVWTGLLLAAGLGTWKAGVLTRPPQAKESAAELSVQTGVAQLKRITLPDSSVVTLNANSVIHYAADFQSNRQVRLQGEAFFDVTPDEKHPFIIFTQDSIRTTVLGTSFNISCYADTRITVATGSVRVSKASETLATLRPQEAVHYDRTTGQYARFTGVSAEAASGWTKGHWEYDTCRLADLASLLRNQYGITLAAAPGRENVQTGVSVNFTRQQSPQEIMDIFCGLAGCRYRFDGQRHILVY